MACVSSSKAVSLSVPQTTFSPSFAATVTAMSLPSSVPSGISASISLIAPPAGRQRDLVVAMIVARVIDARSKLATARGLNPESAVSSLGQMLELGA